MAGMVNNMKVKQDEEFWRETKMKLSESRQGHCLHPNKSYNNMQASSDGINANYSSNLQKLAIKTGIMTIEELSKRTCYVAKR